MAKILVLDGDRILTDGLSTELAQRGATVRVYQDASTAMVAASRERPELFVLSAELSRSSGFAVCNRLKKDPRLLGVPVLILWRPQTADTVTRHQGLATRANDYLELPASPERLVERIGKLVRLGPKVAAPALPATASLPSESRPDGARGTPLEIVARSSDEAPTGPASTRSLATRRPGRSLRPAPRDAGSVAGPELGTAGVGPEQERLALREALQARDREHCELGETLRARDRELLEARERLGGSERELLEARERILATDRGVAQMRARLAELERELREQARRLEASEATKELADARASDFRARLEQTAEQLERATFEVRQARTAHAEALSAIEHRRHEERQTGATRSREELVRVETGSRLALEQLRAAQAEELDGLRRQAAETLEGERREAAAAREAARRDAALALETARGEHAASVAALEADIEGLRIGRDALERELRQQAAAELRAAAERAAKDKLSATEAIERTQQARLGALETELVLQRDDATALERRCQSLEQRACERELEHERQLAAMRQEHGRRIEALTAEHQAELDALRAAYGDLVAGAAAEHQGEIDALRESHIRRLDELQTTHASELEALRARHEKRVSALIAEHQRESEQAVRASELEREHWRDLAESRGRTLDERADKQREDAARAEQRHVQLCAELEASHERAARLELGLGEVQARSDQTELELGRALGRADEATQRAAELERRERDTRVVLEERVAELELARAHLASARCRWDQDRSALAQARATLSAVVGQLHQAARAPLLESS